MRIAFNALSVSNLSGFHVLSGHVEQTLAAADEAEGLVLIHRRSDRAMAERFAGRMECVALPDAAGHWLLRRVVEARFLPKILRSRRIDVLFQPDGALAPVGGVRQWVLAQNPWCFYPALHFTPLDRAKARLQRRAYAAAQRGADMMFFNSGIMAELYASCGGVQPRGHRILHQGVAEDAFVRGRSSLSFADRNQEILAVSAMAPHKNIEALVGCLARLLREGINARLVLVGGWPDAAYRRRILEQVAAAGLQAAVTFVGHVTRAELLEHFASARVFCLLSRCESFGIPAIEAQACGTPCVVSEGTAAPEIAGPGGRVVNDGDIAGTVAALSELLTDAGAWEAAHEAALRNADRFHWSRCSMPLVDALQTREQVSA